MKKLILVIDDEAVIRDLLARFLNDSGYRVMVAGSAADALQTIRQEPPQLIISDLQLEDADGLVMIASLKTTLPNTPVILLTGALYDAEVVRDVLSKQVAAYLPKTSTLKRIMETVHQLLGPPEKPAAPPS